MIEIQLIFLKILLLILSQFLLTTFFYLEKIRHLKESFLHFLSTDILLQQSALHLRGESGKNCSAVNEKFIFNKMNITTRCWLRYSLPGLRLEE